MVITDNPFLMPKLPDRRKNELMRSVRMNLDSPLVYALHLLNQAPNQTLYPGGKLHVYDLGWRSTFLDAIRYANAMLPPQTVFVVANADIVFAHESVRLIPRIQDSNVVVALSRHDVHEDGRATLHEDPPLSQDAWFMRTPFPEHPGFDFPMGTLGSDNKLAYLYKRTLNKTVVNWCNDVVIWHFHSSQHRGAKARLPQPYERVPSSRVNLSMLAATWKKTHVKSSYGWSLHAISLDIPRLTGSPRTTSDVALRQTPPQWSAATLNTLFMYAISRFRGRLGKPSAAHYRHTNALGREVYFLDVPWQLLASETQRIREGGNLLQHVVKSMPWLPLEQVTALIPEDVVPSLCRGAREWRQILLVAIDGKGKFKGQIFCPPFQGSIEQ